MVQKDEHENGDGSPQMMLYRYILDPKPERLPELTDLPLLLITPLTWVATLDEVFRECVAQVEYAAELRRYKRAVARGDTKAKLPEPPVPQLPSEVYRKWYYKHRRSLSGAGVMGAQVLAAKQLEVATEMQSPDQMAHTGRD